MENYPLMFLHSQSSPSSHHHHHDETSMELLGSFYGGGASGVHGIFMKEEEEVVVDKAMLSAPQGRDHEGEVNNEANRAEKKARRHRYAFHTRSQVDILDDGYRWRKYGQKAVKNNNFPRSYYRCTQQGCNVKKQVQRLSKDEGTVVTTYEGTHTHQIEKSNDNFENILNQMQIYSNF